jgi:hypothetical protein
MKQNLFWAAICNVVAIPVAAGALYPSIGLLPRPEFGALAMSASSITVITNALLLRRTEASSAKHDMPRRVALSRAATMWPASRQRGSRPCVVFEWESSLRS